MMKQKTTLTIITALCLLSAISTTILADGKYFPDKAYRTTPAIHSQRAILKYKDNQETLVIESSFDGQGKDFGWVIPLPAIPTNFKQATPGFLKTLSQTIQPKIIHDDTRILRSVLPIAAIVGLIIILMLFCDVRKKLSIWTLLFILFYLGMVAMVFMPALGMPLTPIASRGVNVLDTQEVGSFALTVLQADNAKALDNWLAENNFAQLNKTEQKIISDYIKEDWCFVAAKLKRDGEGYTEPHPLAMTFKTDKPIYPMRLTAAANSNVFLELFVIADKYANSPLLTIEQASRYVFDPGMVNAKGRYCKIGHPENNKYMWDKCVITRLCNTLTPDQMKIDIAVELNEGKDFQKSYYIHKIAFYRGLFYGLIAWFSIFIILAFLSNRNKNRLDWKGKISIKKVFLPATSTFLIIAGIFYLTVDKIDISEVKTVGKYVEISYMDNILNCIYNVDTKKGFANCQTVQDVEKVLEEKAFPEILEYKPNDTSNIKFEDSPGNITVHKDDRGLYIRFYHRGGFYEEYILNEVDKNLQQ